MKSRTTATTLLMAAAGGLAVSLGLTVLVGWHTHNNALLQIRPTWIAMVYNSALCFVLSGSALLTLAAGAGGGRPALACGAVVLAVGGLNVFEVATGVDAGIDGLFMEPYNRLHTPHPGRMALPSAVCFVLTGSALLAASGVAPRRARPASVAVLGSVVVGLGTVAVTGYMFGINKYDFGALIPMAAHTAIGFTVLGVGLVAFAWRDVRAGSGGAAGDLPPWLPIPVVLGGLAATLSLWQPLSGQRHAQASLPGGVWSSVPEAVMAMGFVTTGMLAWVVRMALRSGEHAGRVEAVNRKMAVEIAERSRAEGALRKTSGDLQLTLSAVRETVAQLTAAATQILASTSQQASGGRETAAAVTEVLTTVDHIAQTADQAAERARGVGASVRRTAEIGAAGVRAVEGAAVAMTEVRGLVEATAARLLSLAEQAQAIDDIIATVNEIAEQTKILALNAAIEASRAGEHGRGFAVVAAEVKSLADQSKRATVRVRQILGEVQRWSGEAVTSTGEVTRGVASAVDAGGEAGRAIATLSEALTEAARASAQIAASAGQQATGMGQISQAMRSVDLVVQQNLTLIRQIDQAAADLNTLSRRLAETVAIGPA